MKVLIVHAHENKNSFCSALANTAKTTFETMGHPTTISDLYLKQFNPVGGKHDFEQLSNATYYKYAGEQLHAHQNHTFSFALRKEMELLLAADVLLFNFPLWWFDMPAILKGWVDRVLAYGFAYGGEYGMGATARFAGRKAFLTITTGSPESLYQIDGAHGRTINDILQNIHRGILALVGYDVLEPFIAFGVSRATDEERKTTLNAYRNYLLSHFGTSS